MQESIYINEIYQYGKIFALASSNQVKNGKSNKSPAINWDESPNNYKGISDKNYGSALVCDSIPQLDKYLVVIDFDKPKMPDHIQLKVLKSISLKMIENTYCIETPSGGLHIYLLSMEKPVKPPKILNKLNIDFQANYGNGNGKYVVANYRWDPTGKFKEHYKKLVESPNKIKVVKNVNEILNSLLSDLEDAGHIKNEIRNHLEEIVEILKPYAKTTEVKSRQYYSCGIAGYLKKQGYKQDTVEEIIREVFSEDEEIESRINNVERTYEKENKEIIGWEILKDYLPKIAQEALLKLTQNNHDDLKSEIIKKLAKHKEPTSKQLFDYISMCLDLYINLDTLKYYEKMDEGAYQEINEKRIIEFVIKEFGNESISRTKCQEVLKHIINPINVNYNLLEFNNGILNTETKEFLTDKTLSKEIPKERINLNWNSKAAGGYLEEVISKILFHPIHSTNMDLWLKAVGHAFMGWNSLQKITVVTGPPGTGKSTLTTILKRLFKYSEISLQNLAKPDRFTYYSLVDKSINIDDDVQNGALIGIGKLNTIISGNGFETEVKHEKRTIMAENQQIPRLFCNGNSLPPVIGEGWSRRLLLILAENVVSEEKRDNLLQARIQQGKYDKELEWLVYTAINKFWNLNGNSITAHEEETKMQNLFDKKSDPLKIVVAELYQSDFDGNSKPVKEIYHYVKKRCQILFEKGEISREFKKPSITRIREAMDRAGFGIIRKSDGNYFEDIEITQEFKLLVGTD